ncbi:MULTISPECIES: carbohydrate ABC transporter permease [Humibacter]
MTAAASSLDVDVVRRPGEFEGRAARKKRLVWRVVTHACIWVGVLLSLFPFYWLFAMSTQSTAQIFGYPPDLLPSNQLWSNIKGVLGSVDLFQAMLNSFIVSGSCALLVMFFDSLAAFTFAKFEFPGKKVLFGILLTTFLIPGSLSLVPSFVLMSKLGWVGGLQALIIPGAANAFGIFLLRQFFESSLPNELVESARVDGAGFFRTYWSIGLPMVRGGIAFLGIFTFIGAWNDYVWPLVVLVNPGTQTLQTALAALNSLYSTNYGWVMAGALISVLPLIAIFIIGSRHFIANIAAGAVKG